MAGEELLIPEMPQPPEGIASQEPTRDIPTGRGQKIDEGLIKSSNTPEDIQNALESISHKGEAVDNKEEEK